jgi:hypothetical protein
LKSTAGMSALVVNAYISRPMARFPSAENPLH